jgi:dTDP-4-dehydrorhamnose reductase
MNDISPLEILIVGGDGFMGGHLRGILSGTRTRFGHTTRRKDSQLPSTHLFDFSQPPCSWNPLPNTGTAIICAGITSIAECRDHPDESHVVNVTHTIELARQFAAQGVFIVFLSTNLVFDGQSPFPNETTGTRPTTVYGMQKATVEKAILEMEPRPAIVRLTKVLSRNHPLLANWRKELDTHQPIHPFDNLVFSPVTANYAVNALLEITRRKMGGIWHLSGSKDLTYAKAALNLASSLGAPSELVQPVTAELNSMPYPKLPMHAALGTSSTRAKLNIHPQDPAILFKEIISS